MTKIMEFILYRINNVAFIEFSNYRTENENEVFKIMRLFLITYSDKKEKTTNDFHRLSPFVGMRRLERPTPTSRT